MVRGGARAIPGSLPQRGFVLWKSTHPKVVSTGGPDLGTVANHVGNETRAKVTSQVDGIARLPAEAGTDAEDEEEQTERRKGSSAGDGVDEGEDDKLEDGGGHKFGEEHA